MNILHIKEQLNIEYESFQVHIKYKQNNIAQDPRTSYPLWITP